MEIGIFSRTYEVGDLNETYRRMTGQEIFHTQFNLSNAGMDTLPQTYGEKQLEQIGELTSQYHIVIDAISGTFNMIDPDEEKREQGIRQFGVQCEIAKKLGIPIVTLCTGSKNPQSKWKWHEDNLKAASWDDLMRSTERILNDAEKQNVILGVETEASNIINTPERARKYLDAFGSDHLKIIMDGANLFLPEQVERMDEVLEEAFALLGKDIVLAHAKDISFDGALAFVAAGEGVLDFPYYIKLLKQSGYAGALVMHGLSEAQVIKSRDFLQKLIQNEEK